MIFKKLHNAGKVCFCAVLLLSIVFVPVFAISPTYHEDGSPAGILKAHFSFFDGAGTRPSNTAYYHACSDPAYSPSNLVVGDSSVGAGAKAPAWQNTDADDMASLDFTRSEKDFVVALDNPAACTTGNNSLDYPDGTANMFTIGAWIKPEVKPSCSSYPAGTKFYLFDKWNAGASECSYQMWLEIVDTNGGVCNDADLKFAVRAQFDDSGSTFSCSTPCEVAQPTTVLDTDTHNGWAHVALFIDMEPSTSNSYALIKINGKRTVTEATAQSCQDATNIPEDVIVNNSTARLYMGNDSNNGSEGFEGKISQVMVIAGEDGMVNTARRMYLLAHMDDGAEGVRGLNGGGNNHQQFLVDRGAITFADGRYGDAAVFNGSTTSLMGITGILEEDEFTGGINGFVAEAWIYPTSVGGSTQTIVSQWDVGNDASCTVDTTDSSYRLYINSSSQLEFQVVSATGTVYTVTGNTTLSNNHWYHVAGLVTPSTTSYLTADSLYVHVNGQDNTGGSPTSFSTDTVNTGQQEIRIGSDHISATTTTPCSSSAIVNGFTGRIDEVRINTWASNFTPEYYNPGVVINEVNFQVSEEKIELHIPSHLTQSIDLDGYTIGVCGATAKGFTFDDSCGAGCKSKIVDPGDIVTVVLSDPTPPDAIDSSCNGAATTCSWFSDNANNASPLVAGDISTSDGVALFGTSQPTNAAQARAGLIDIVMWGGVNEFCNNISVGQSNGNWQARQFVVSGATTDGSKSISLAEDGNDQDAVSSWRQGTSTIGSLNSSASTAVDLIDFGARRLAGNSAEIFWTTGAERDTLGFKVLGSNARNGIYTEKSALIVSRGNIGSGAYYQFIDNNSSTFYKLLEVELSGIENHYGPVTYEEEGLRQLGDAPVEVNPTSNTDDAINGSPSDDGSYARTSAGCGTMLATETRAPGVLVLLLILVIFSTLRTHAFFRIRPRKLLWLIAMGLPLLVATSSFALTPPYTEAGDPEDAIRKAYYPFVADGTRPENYANYHVCTTPAYSQANFEELDSIKGGATGLPERVAIDETNMPSWDYERSNKEFIRIPDNNTNCTVGNDPNDHTLGVDNAFVVGAWVKPDITLSCVGTPAGTEYHVFSKWDEVGDDCSYKLWLEVVDTNRGACNDQDLELQARAYINDDSTNFSCASPCEVERPDLTFPDDINNGWVHVGLLFTPQPSGQAAAATILYNGSTTAPAIDRQSCQDSTDVPEDVTLNNSDADLFLGVEINGDADAFEGQIGPFSIFSGVETEVTGFPYMHYLNHFEGSVDGMPLVTGGGGLIRQYSLRKGGVSLESPGRYGNAMRFDGSTGYLRSVTGVFENVVDTADPNSITVEAWIKLDSTAQRMTIASQWIVEENGGSCEDDISESSYQFVVQPGGQLFFEVATSAGTTLSATGVTSLNTDEWYHVSAHVTPSTVSRFSADSIYVAINGVSDMGGSPVSFGSNTINAGRTPILVGAMGAPANSTICATGSEGALHFFDGLIDELRINSWENDVMSEVSSGGVVINEVSYKGSEDVIELHIPSHLDQSIDLNGWTIGVCSKPLKRYTFNNACGTCVSRVVDPGDIVKVRIADGVPPTLMDSSCSGAAKTCDWTSETSPGANPLVAGDIVDAGDGVVLWRGALPTTTGQAYARMADMMQWADTTYCGQVGPHYSRGFWQYDRYVESGLVTGSTKSLCLEEDGNNEKGVLSWRQCNASIGSLNSSAATAVDLIAFDAHLQASGEALVSFQTGSEINTFGFKVLGADSANDVYVEKSTLILARGGVGSGAFYQFSDIAPSAYYKLKEIEISGLENLYGPTRLASNIRDARSSTSGALNDNPTANPVDGVLTTDNQDSTAPRSASGCGVVVAHENRAPGFLALFLVIVVMISTRTHLMLAWIRRFKL